MVEFDFEFIFLVLVICLLFLKLEFIVGFVGESNGWVLCRRGEWDFDFFEKFIVFLCVLVMSELGLNFSSIFDKSYDFG